MIKNVSQPNIRSQDLNIHSEYMRQKHNPTEEIWSADTVSWWWTPDTGAGGAGDTVCTGHTAPVVPGHRRRQVVQRNFSKPVTRCPVIITSDQLTYPGVALHSDADAQATLCCSSITLWLLGFSLASSRTVSVGPGSTWKLPSLSDLEFGLFCGRFEIPTVRILVIKLTQPGSWLHISEWAVSSEDQPSPAMVYLEQLQQDLEGLANFPDAWKGRKMPGECRPHIWRHLAPYGQQRPTVTHYAVIRIKLYNQAGELDYDKASSTLSWILW